MVEPAEQNSTQQRLETLTTALHSGTAEQVRQLLASLHPAEIGDLLESLPHGPREILWELVDAEDKGEVLVEVNEEVRAGLIEGMETAQLVAITGGLDTDDLADRVAGSARRSDPRITALDGQAEPPPAGSRALLSGGYCRRSDGPGHSHRTRQRNARRGVALFAPARRNSGPDRQPDGGRPLRPLSGAITAGHPADQRPGLERCRGHGP